MNDPAFLSPDDDRSTEEGRATKLRQATNLWGGTASGREKMDCEREKEVSLPRPPSTHSLKSALKSLNLPSLPPTMPLPPIPVKKGCGPTRPTLMAINNSRSASSSSLNPQPLKFIKYGKGKHSNVELMPQPSDDRQDPLNWPQWKKNLNLISLLMMVGLIGSMKTVFIATNGAVASRYQVSHLLVAALTAVPLMVSAMTGLVSAIFAKTRGKRPVYLLSALLVFFGSIWNMTAGDSFGSCMGARVMQSLGWGAFDTLLMESIQDTYFEHEQHLKVFVYNILAIATLWGSPLIGGIISHKNGSLVVQYRIISAMFLIAIPLLVLGAPETAFDRARAAIAPTPTSACTPSENMVFSLEAGDFKVTKESIRPWSFTSNLTSSTIAIQILRAFAAPTTILVLLLNLLPFVALWCFSSTLARLLTPSPVQLKPPLMGLVMAGPLLLASLVVFCLFFYRASYTKLTCLTTFLTILGGSVCAIAGLFSYGIYLGTGAATPTHYATGPADEPNIALLSFQLGLVAAGAYAMDATIRPILSYSASFTASSMAVAQRSIGNMHSGIVIMRNLLAGVCVLVMSQVLSATGGLKWIAMIIGSVQAALTIVMFASMILFDEHIWKADGKVMGLLDLRSLRLCGSFFDVAE